MFVWVRAFFIWMPQVHSILFFTANNNFVFIIYGIFIQRKLGLIAFLFLGVSSINVKGNIFSKFFNKCCTYPQVRMFFCSLLLFIPVILLVLFRDTETNPGPEQGYSNSFSFCHWNLDSIAAHSSIKISLLQAYDSINKFDIIFLSRTYLDNSSHSNDDQLALPGYNGYY